MTRLSIALAATLAAAVCLLIGVVIGRDSRTPDYYAGSGFRDDERVDSV